MENQKRKLHSNDDFVSIPEKVIKRVYQSLAIPEAVTVSKNYRPNGASSVPRSIAVSRNYRPVARVQNDLQVFV